MTRPVLLTENSRSVLVAASGQTSPRKLPQYIAAFVSTLSAVCLGVVFSWTSSAIPALENEFGMSQSQGAWVGSLVTLGAFTGAIPTGSLSHWFGRKRTLQILIIPMFISWLTIAYFYHHLVALYIARFVAGFSSGGISVAAPMYVSELAHVSIRGTLGTFFQVQITIGLLVGYLLGNLFSDIKTLSLVCAILPLVFLLTSVFIPESPVYYCEKSQTEDAQKSLSWFRGDQFDIEDELVRIIDDIAEAKRNKAKLSDLVSCKATYKALIISLGLMIFQQLSGVNAVLFYSNTIFQQSGGSYSPGECTILVGFVQVVATMCSTFLVDKAGRKILLIFSDMIMCLSLAALGLYFYLSHFIDLRNYSLIPLVSLALFIIFFSIGFGPIPWMIMGEIFPPKVKGIASSISASFNWFLAFIVPNQFANLVDAFGIGPTFMIFSVICAAGTVFVTILVPETKGRSIEQLTSILLGNPCQSEIPAGDDSKLEKMCSAV